MNKGNAQCNQEKTQFDVKLQTLHLRNLSTDVTEQDIINFFGLKSTKHLEKKCQVQMPSSNIPGEEISFAFITAPSHVTNELVKLNGVNIKGKNIIIEKAQT